MQRLPPERHPRPSVLEIKLPGFLYRTDDKTHAASLLFSALLLIALIVVTITQAIIGADDHGLGQWLCNSFLVVVSVAIGRAGTRA